jgi:hypothetical protein
LVSSFFASVFASSANAICAGNAVAIATAMRLRVVCSISLLEGVDIIFLFKSKNQYHVSEPARRSTST